MMTNKQPWKTIINPSLLSKAPVKETKLSIIKGFGTGIQQSSAPFLKPLPVKRYSFDDNGGGYLGL